MYIKFEKQQLFHGVRIYVRKEPTIGGSRERFLEIAANVLFLDRGAGYKEVSTQGTERAYPYDVCTFIGLDFNKKHCHLVTTS